jgi:hypothetical protein
MCQDIIVYMDAIDLRTVSYIRNFHSVITEFSKINLQELYAVQFYTEFLAVCNFIRNS